MKPMLAAEAPAEINFPVYASPKIDGIRAIIKRVDMDTSQVLSRSLKPIPNLFVQTELGRHALDGLDGELTVGPANAKNCMQATTSGVMTQRGQPDFTFWVFDYWTSHTDIYDKRLQSLRLGMNEQFKERNPRVQLLNQIIINDGEGLAEYERSVLERGYEGVIIRSPSGKYKYGRSTAKEGLLLKVKRFKDSEAIVMGFEELMHNANEATLDNLGHTQRSSHKDGKVPMGTLGALVVKDMATNITFSIGTGFVQAERQYIWDHKQFYIDQIVCYKHFETGVKVAPRFPVFKGFRHADDLAYK